MILVGNICDAQTFHRVGRWPVSMHVGVGYLGRTDKAGGVLLWGHASGDSMVDSPQLKYKGCLHNREMGRNAKGI